MRFFPSIQIAGVFAILPLFMLMVSGERVFLSSSLDVCQSNSSFTASLFNIAFTPSNRTLSINVVADSAVTGNITFKVEAAAYGYTFLTEEIDPCTLGIPTLCPLSQIQIGFQAIYPNISANIINRIPSIAYGIPDLDATITVHMYAKSNPSVSQGCVRTRLSNGQTVQQNGVRWATAIIVGLGLVAAGLVSVLGHSNAAAHVAGYTTSLFNYFQAIASIGLCAIALPPIVQSWTLDFAWSLGLIKVDFLQRMATWYQTATGGTPTTILATLSTHSVQVSKRDGGSQLYPRAAIPLTSSGEYSVTGISRAAFLQNIEPSNLFFTGLTWYCIFVIVALLGVVIFKQLSYLGLRAKWTANQTNPYQGAQANWLVTLKGVIFRLILIGYFSIIILCSWEFTQNDSSAEIFLAVIFFFGMSAALALAAFTVIKIGKKSQLKYQTPAYLLYADALVLSKWGFLYTQFTATAYYYIVPALSYILVKAMFIGFGQKSGITQAVALFILEAAALIGASVLRPWMDKSVNNINIAICVVNFINAIFLLIFTNIFNGPGLLIGVVGVVFFFMNVVFALVLLCIVIFASILSIIRKNPDIRYEPITDNRASFIKSQTALNTELDSLGVTARGDGANQYRDPVALHDEKDFHSPDALHNIHENAYDRSYGIPSSAPMTPASAPAYYSSHETLANDSQPPRSRGNHEPSLGSRPDSTYSDTVSSLSAQNDRAAARHQQATGPWQRTAGYDH